MGVVVFSSGGWGRVDSTSRDKRLVPVRFSIGCSDYSPVCGVHCGVLDPIVEERRGEGRLDLKEKEEVKRKSQKRNKPKADAGGTDRRSKQCKLFLIYC